MSEREIAKRGSDFRRARTARYPREMPPLMGTLSKFVTAQVNTRSEFAEPAMNSNA